MLCVRRWRRSDAGPAGRVRCWKVKCLEPKIGQQKVQLYNEDDPFYPSRYTIYQCCFPSCFPTPPPNPSAWLQTCYFPNQLPSCPPPSSPLRVLLLDNLCYSRQ